MPQEARDWLDVRDGPTHNGVPWGSRPGSGWPRSQGPWRRKAAPTAEEIRAEQQRATVAVANLSGGEASPRSTGLHREDRGSDTDARLESSTALSVEMPVVTTGTSKDII
ncbi:hypothetical protein NDU88_002964 [Pleurodeles waltl]|uniref:Uncharacterized protein n=1 Tax=Pleurodeles waltl TaxID=8319 RepID=A0AAV7REZ7_PLEWA|nr:hypothetical protein NDU88_002964 [Pleurodeles waltl]